MYTHACASIWYAKSTILLSASIITRTRMNTFIALIMSGVVIYFGARARQIVIHDLFRR